MVVTPTLIIGGVDTHADTHTVAALNSLGQVLGHATFPATKAGYRALLGWLSEHGQLEQVGVEGTGSYGAGLARYLSSQGITVLEVDRPNRQQRRRNGKSDPVDAVAAARAVQAGTATATAKSRTGVAESLRVLRATRRSAEKARTAALNSLLHMVIAAPEDLREQFDGLTGKALISACAALRPDPDQLHDTRQATKLSLRRLARRAAALSAELAEVKADINTLVTQAAPELLAHAGVGPDTASQLLVTAGDNPDRLHNDASFAALCGASPVSASSGRTDRHRVNRGGDPAGQLRLVADRPRPNGPPPTHPRIRCPSHCSRPEQTRDHALLETLRRPRTTPRHPTRTHTHRNRPRPPAQPRLCRLTFNRSIREPCTQLAPPITRDRRDGHRRSSEDVDG